MVSSEEIVNACQNTLKTFHFSRGHVYHSKRSRPRGGWNLKLGVSRFCKFWLTEPSCGQSLTCNR